MKKLLFRILIAIAALLVILVCSAFGWVFYKKRQYAALTDTHDLAPRIEKLATDYIKEHPNGALVVGVISGSNQWVKGFGKGPGTNATPDEKTIFEIGSVTKVFTGILLSDFKAQGLVQSTNTIGSLLPKDVGLPDGLGEKITLFQLATHTAGLPRIPKNGWEVMKDENNPYKDYSSNDLYAALRDLKLEHPPGAKMEYSNFGFGLLGHLLELRAQTPFEQLIQSRICEPLHLSDTKCVLAPEQLPRLVKGHSAKGDEVSHWDFKVFAPAGALKSTAADLIAFLEANLRPKGPLVQALEDAQKIRVRKGAHSLGYAWHEAHTIEQLRFLWHNGATGGFTSFIGLDRKRNNAVVVLSNYEADGTVDTMGLEILKFASKVSLQ